MRAPYRAFLSGSCLAERYCCSSLGGLAWVPRSSRTTGSMRPLSGMDPFSGLMWARWSEGVGPDKWAFGEIFVVLVVAVLFSLHRAIRSVADFDAAHERFFLGGDFDDRSRLLRPANPQDVGSGQGFSDPKSATGGLTYSGETVIQGRLSGRVGAYSRQAQQAFTGWREVGAYAVPGQPCPGYNQPYLRTKSLSRQAARNKHEPQPDQRRPSAGKPAD